MTTQKLIEALLKLDPEGDTEVRISVFDEGIGDRRLWDPLHFQVLYDEALVPVEVVIWPEAAK